MTTKTDITLLPCPFCGGEAEMDTRQGYLALGTGRLGNRIAAYCRSCNADMGVCVEDVPDIEPEQVADMWNRRAAVEADRQGRMPSDEEIIASVVAYGEACASLITATEREMRLHDIRALLSRYSSGQPAASAEPDDMTPLDDRATYPASMIRRLIREDRARRAAPVAQEPVGEAGTMPGTSGFTTAVFRASDVPVGTKLYAAPVAAQAQPQQSENQEALADTQRAIIEAAERRGYERAIAECAQDREDADLLDWLREETCDLRCINQPTGGDDYEVRWVVISHHMAKPHEREIGRSFTDDPRDAIRAARAAKGADHA